LSSISGVSRVSVEVRFRSRQAGSESVYFEETVKRLVFPKIMRIFQKFSAAIFTGPELLERLKTPA
jgi:hypothetical protein